MAAPHRAVGLRRSLVGAVALTLTSVGCGDRGPVEGRSVTGAGSRDCVPAGLAPVADEASRLPAGLTLLPGTQLVTSGATAAAGTLTVEAPGNVRDAYASYKAQITAAKHRITKTDDEGREAEIFYDAAPGSHAVIQLSTPACPSGVVRIVFTGAG